MSTGELAGMMHPLLLSPRDTPASRTLHDLLTRLRLDRCSYMRCRVVKKGDPFEPLFLTMLLEDRSPAGTSYVEWLVHVHKQITGKLG